MESPIHTLASLFDQLGLSSEGQDIENFIRAAQASLSL